MKERCLFPQNPDEIIRELTSPNLEELDQFSKHFPQEVVDFAESFSDVFKKYLELRHSAEKNAEKTRPIGQKDFVVFFSYQILDNLFTSFKTLLMGFQTASGNLMRQVAEGVAVVILCATNSQIKRKDKTKTKSFQYYECFKIDKSYARSHNAIRLLENNKEIVRISDYGLEMLKLLKEYNNRYSHPNFWSTSSFISIGNPGKMYIGGCFDEGKVEWYKQEIEARIQFCRELPRLFDGLIFKVKNLQT